MKKLLYLLLCILPVFAFVSCEEKEELVFDHEIPQFEIKADAILIEVIVPRETTNTDDIYIVGDFNGGLAAMNDEAYKLERSKVNLRWGIYLDPTKFVEGKTLADGYYFINTKQGKEITLDNVEVVRNESAAIGTRLEMQILRWEAFLKTSDDWPIITNNIMLKIFVPESTPEKSKIALYGNVNGWNGEDSKWHATMLTPTKYYMLLDPADFAEGTSLADEFKLAVVKSGREWWYHQANLDGGGDDGPGMFVEDAVLGKGYDLEIVNWRNVAEINDITEEPKPNMIRFKQVEGNWEEFAVYAWGDAEHYGGWPGLVLEADDNGWYSFEVPEDLNLNLILNNNNGGKQFDFLTGNIVGACYEINTNTSEWTEVDCPTEGGSDDIVIRWKYVGAEWTQFGIYAWGGSLGETFGSWPGTMATPDAEGWCEVVVPAGETVGNVIFNNGNGGDGNQFDVAMEITESVCFEITSSSYTVVDCP